MKEDVLALFKLNAECHADRQRLELLITALAGNVATLAMKIGLMAGIGAILGSGLMTYVLSLLK